jgi:hypothetical protein
MVQGEDVGGEVGDKAPEVRASSTKPTLDRTLRNLEESGDLRVGALFEVTQGQDFPVFVGEMRHGFPHTLRHFR